MLTLIDGAERVGRLEVRAEDEVEDGLDDGLRLRESDLVVPPVVVSDVLSG